MELFHSINKRDKIGWIASTMDKQRTNNRYNFYGSVWILKQSIVKHLLTPHKMSMYHFIVYFFNFSNKLSTIQR